MNIKEFNFNLELMRFLFWEYQDSNVDALLQYQQDAMNQLTGQFFDDWITDVFNIDTCNDFGISFWAIVLDVPLLLEVDIGDEKLAWGFGLNRANFAPPSNFGINASGVALLTRYQKRSILKMKYLKMIGTGNPWDFNSTSSTLVGDLGTMWMKNNEDHTIDYCVDFEPPTWLVYTYANFDIFPTPYGTEAGATLVYIP